MSDLGSFGPGWFYNIFGISIELENSVSVVDDGEVFAIPWFSFTGKKLLFTNKDNLIKGKITLNTYNNQREVWHGGVKVSYFFIYLVIYLIIILIFRSQLKSIFIL